MKAEADRADQAGAEDTGRNSVVAAACAEADMATRTRTKAGVATTSLMDAVVERGNLMLAYQRVVENKGAAGVDQLAVSELKDHLKRHWPTIRARLLAGDVSTAAGAPGRNTEAGRSGRTDAGHPRRGGPADPTQAVLQVLQPRRLNPTFSDGSFGFRPGRGGTHDALRQSREHVRGRVHRWWWTWTWRSSSTG